jgi:hypothetical protein
MLFFRVILCLTLALWLAVELMRAWRTGEARGRVVLFSRSHEPVAYWLLVVVQALAALACLWGAAAPLWDSMSRGNP